MYSNRKVVQAIAFGLLIFPGYGAANEQGQEGTEQKCPKLSFDEVRARYKPALSQIGEAQIDRAIFWERMKEIANANEVFRFKARKKNKATGEVTFVEKEVAFHKNVVNSEHRAVINAIFDRWEATGGGHPKHLALLLGTASRETCGSFLSSVGEACGCTRTCGKDEYKDAPYGKKDKCGRAYFGRGLVQLTKKINYENVGENLGIPLGDYPNLAYEQPFSIMMLVDGVKGRWYAGKPLKTYLNDEASNWVLARESVNPNSPNKAATGYLACRFYDAIQPAYKKTAPAQDPSLCMKLKNP
ncbi:MAG: glycoside hydrolase family 19 protein [Pseudomonas sp.]